MAERSTAVVSCGLSLLSSGMISNFTPEAFFLLNSSAISWKVLSWFVPTAAIRPDSGSIRSEEHTSELQSQSNLVCRLLLEKKKKHNQQTDTITTTKPT